MQWDLSMTVSNGTLTLYDLKEDTLQFEEDVQLEAETVVVGAF